MQNTNQIYSGLSGGLDWGETRFGFQKPKGHEDWDSWGRFQAGLALEVSLKGGAEPGEALVMGWLSPGWGPKAGKPLFQ